MPCLFQHRAVEFPVPPQIGMYRKTIGVVSFFCMNIAHCEVKKSEVILELFMFSCNATSYPQLAEG